MKITAKSIFVPIFPAAAVIIAVLTAYKIFCIGFTKPTFGLLLTTLSILCFFASIFVIVPARTSKFLLGFSVPMIIGFFIILSDLTNPNFDLTSFSYGLGLILSWVFYLTWYSSYGDRTNILLNVGSKFPDITLEDNNKNPIPSSRFIGQKTMYLFYRGNWCPICMGQINEVIAQYKALDEKNVNMVFVSPQPHKYSEELSKKHGLNFMFLTDPYNAAASILNIVDKNGIPAGFQALGYTNNSVLPTVIITNDRGEIVFADLTDNYRLRPEPESFLKIINDLA